MEILPIVIGFGGHTDHGKTSLIKLLTGKMTQRLKDENARGLSIDMGFASFTTEEGKTAGVIDVPGHEDFTRNMIAGSFGVDIAILVVAADDGVMPQTREHLKIFDLLGKKRGFTVINKSDLVEPELLELASGEIRDIERGTFLEGRPIVKMSSVTGEGFDNFWNRLSDEISKTPPRLMEGRFIMDVQRAFSSRGKGIIITGIPDSGSIKRGDRVEIFPSKAVARVKNIQAYGRDINVARAGHSTAMNLTGVDREDVFRGSVATEPEAFRASKFFSGRMTTTKNFPESDASDKAIFCTGTARIQGRARPLTGKTVEPGTSTPMQVVLDSETALRPGQRFLVIPMGYRTVEAGGTVARIDNKKIPTGNPENLSTVMKLEKSLENPEKMIEAIASCSHGVLGEKDFLLNTGITKKTFKDCLRILEAEGRIIFDHHKNKLLHTKILKKTCDEIMKLLVSKEEEISRNFGVGFSEVRKELSLDKWRLHKAVEKLEREGVLIVASGKINTRTNEEEKSERSEEIKKVEAYLIERGYRFPTMRQVLGRFEKEYPNIGAIIGYMEGKGMISKATGFARDREYVFHSRLIQQAEEKIREIISSKGGIRFIDIKENLGISFNYAVAMIHYFRESGLLRQAGKQDVLCRESGK